MISIQWKALPHLAESFKKIFNKDKDKDSDKRRAPRARSRNLVRAESEDRLTLREHLSNLVDLSETGVRFASKKKVKVGTVLNMVINLAEKETRVPVTGVVVWSRQIRSGSPGYYIGVAFAQVSDEHRHLMHELVESYRKRRSIR